MREQQTFKYASIDQLLTEAEREISKLRADVERLTLERDEAVAMFNHNTKVLQHHLNNTRAVLRAVVVYASMPSPLRNRVRYALDGIYE